jgi:hypothetical protein
VKALLSLSIATTTQKHKTTLPHKTIFSLHLLQNVSNKATQVGIQVKSPPSLKRILVGLLMLLRSRQVGRIVGGST